MNSYLTTKLASEEARKTRKLLDYYDGDQEEHVEALLCDPYKGRKNWRERGIIPRYRNITAMIVEKSGMLFNGSAPKLFIKDNEVLSNRLTELFDKSQWIEQFINVDSAVRLLKTVIVLVQTNNEDMLTFDVLHQGNCVVEYDKFTREMLELAYRVHTSKDYDEYRRFTKELIEDFRIDHITGNEITISSMPNEYGIIPAVVFHDTRLPRNSFWNNPGCDLMQINEMYNLHLTDSEYTASFAKLKQLFTNADIAGSSDKLETVEIPGRALPTQMPASSGIVGGPGTVVKLESFGGGNVFAQYLGPEVNIQPIDDMFNKWIKDFAADWSVNVKAGAGTASSGFQLVVEEIDNLALRKRRQRMFEDGFKRLFRVIQAMFPSDRFNTSEELFVEFDEPRLPVDESAAEDVWDKRIAGKRATVIDYFIVTYGLSHAEAEEKVIKMAKDEQFINTHLGTINSSNS